MSRPLQVELATRPNQEAIFTASATNLAGICLHSQNHHSRGREDVGNSERIGIPCPSVSCCAKSCTSQHPNLYLHLRSCFLHALDCLSRSFELGRPC